MALVDFIAGIRVGLIGGASSGLLGVSPGGGLVVFSTLFLGCGQHVAQGVSLIAQVAPAGIFGIRRYREKGVTAPLRWLGLLTIGVLAGGIGGALAASHVSSPPLRWTYVSYLTLLDVLLILRGRLQRQKEPSTRGTDRLSSVALLVVGAIAGFSSEFLRIGGGLAITIGLGAWLKAPQHQAQMASLSLSLIPTTLPAAWVYWNHGWSAPWPVICGIVLDLWAGADIGARAANAISAKALRHILVAFVTVMAAYMACKALA